MCMVAESGTSLPVSDRHPEEQFIQGLRMPVVFVPALVFQYVLASEVASMGCLCVGW